MDNSQLMILAVTQWIDKARCDNKFVKRVTRCYGDQSQQPKTLSVIFETKFAKRTNHYYCHYELLLFVHFFVRCWSHERKSFYSCENDMVCGGMRYVHSPLPTSIQLFDAVHFPDKSFARIIKWFYDSLI